MKDMKEVDTILDNKVKKDSGGYGLNQSYYIFKVLDNFNHLRIKQATTPYDTSMKPIEILGRSMT